MHACSSVLGVTGFFRVLHGFNTLQLYYTEKLFQAKPTRSASFLLRFQRRFPILGSTSAAVEYRSRAYMFVVWTLLGISVQEDLRVSTA